MIIGKIKWILVTQLILLLYSIGGIFSKLASQEPFMSIRFLAYYGIVLLLLMVYAIGWQQILKHLSLTTAYMNKAITIIWGIVWGILLFHENLTKGKLVGMAFIILGIYCYVGEQNEPES